MKLDVVLTTCVGSDVSELPIATVRVSGNSVREIRAAVELWACRKFGREGRDWRMRSNPSGYMIPCYAASHAGDTIRLK